MKPYFKYFIICCSLQQGKPLSYDLAYELGQASVEAVVGQNMKAIIDTTAMLTGLYHRATLAHPDTPEMIAGLCAAVFEHDIGKSQHGFLEVPGVQLAMENCGMGGDTIVTPNVSCLSALCAASAGITMIKHGSRSHSDAGQNGSTDFLERCGIPMNLEPKQMCALIKTHKIGYIDAVDTRYKRIHQATMELSDICHLNHLLGPITSPVHPTILRRRVIGINQMIDPLTVAKAYRILNEKGITHMERIFLVRGRGETDADSMDEVSIASKGTMCVELDTGDISPRNLIAADFGVPEASFHDLAIPKHMSKGNFSMAILQGEIKTGPAVDLVCANAALLFYLAGSATNLRDCASLAREQLTKGKAFELVQSIRRTVSDL
jgi:anthranilate phosphoribosyltransferase